MAKFFLGFLIILLIFFASEIRDVSSNNSSIPFENFTLFDLKGQLHEMFYYSDKKAIVLFWQGNGCPIAQKYLNTLNQLALKYKNQDVQFFMVNASPQDAIVDIAEEISDYGVSIPVLKDYSQIFSDELDIKRTATTLLVDTHSWQIIYKGPIDNGLDYGSEKTNNIESYLDDAIQDLLSSKEVAFQEKVVNGCLIGRKSLYDKDELTYTDDIQFLLKDHCFECHSNGGSAPWEMKGYETIRGWGPMIREVIRTKRMPPYAPDFNHDNLLVKQSLYPDDIYKLVRWIEQGMPRGEGEDFLKVDNDSKIVVEWELGEPDMVIPMPSYENIPSSGIIPYRYLKADVVLDRDVWVRAFDMRPGNVKVLHHGALLASHPESLKGGALLDFRKSGMVAGEMDNAVAGYVPGRGPMVLPEDTGIFLPKGTGFKFQLHYVTTGKRERDLSEVGLYFYEDEYKPKNIFSVDRVTREDFEIPSHAKNVQIQATYQFNKDVLLHAVKPHMHYRGKSMDFVARFLDGTEKVLLSVPNYSMNWQFLYSFKKNIKIPKGTTIICRGRYDNSSENSLNPNPNVSVVHGQDTSDEMFRGYLYFSEFNSEK